MTWDAYYRRKDALREMLAIADRRRDVTLTELLDVVDPSRTTFPAETDALFELQMTWFHRLGGHLDRLQDGGTTTAPHAVAVQAWVDTAHDLPGARALLDAHAEEPALRKAFAKELAVLATAAGAPTYDLDLTGHGRRIQDSARESLRTDPVPEAPDAERLGLMARLRSAIAA
jgi:hypothetical protein